MTSSSEDHPKVMAKLKGISIIQHVIDYWKKYTQDFVFVVGYKKEEVIDFVNTLSINSDITEQKELKGIGHAVLCCENLVEEKFIVVLGDCVCKGTFDFPLNMEQGVGVWKTDNENYIKQSYSIEIENNLIKRVEEKPKRPVNNLCGMGFYFFDRIVFKYIRQTKPSILRNEIEITDVIQNMIGNNEKISPLFFKGDYINITFSRDLSTAEEIL